MGALRYGWVCCLQRCLEVRGSCLRRNDGRGRRNDGRGRRNDGGGQVGRRAGRKGAQVGTEEGREDGALAKQVTDNLLGGVDVAIEQIEVDATIERILWRVEVWVSAEE